MALIRQARGGGPRTALKQPEMAALVATRAGLEMDNSRLSRIESGKERKFYEALAILRALKELDPEGRGYDWLIGTEPLPLKKEKPHHSGRRNTVVDPIVTRRPGQRRSKGA
jgi:hypothetical protein